MAPLCFPFLALHSSFSCQQACGSSSSYTAPRPRQLLAMALPQEGASSGAACWSRCTRGNFHRKLGVASASGNSGFVTATSASRGHATPPAPVFAAPEAAASSLSRQAVSQRSYSFITRRGGGTRSGRHSWGCMHRFVVLCCVAVTLSQSLLGVQADKEAHVSSRMVKKEPKGVVKGHSALIRGKQARRSF